MNKRLILHLAGTNRASNLWSVISIYPEQYFIMCQYMYCKRWYKTQPLKWWSTFYLYSSHTNSNNCAGKMWHLDLVTCSLVCRSSSHNCVKSLVKSYEYSLVSAIIKEGIQYEIYIRFWCKVSLGCKIYFKNIKNNQNHEKLCTHTVENKQNQW